MNRVAEIFGSTAVDADLLQHMEALPDPGTRYLIAMTPRSGSSYLCDIISKTRQLGRPDEFINQNFIPGILKKIPGRSPDEYLRNLMRQRQSANGVAGLKASWFQFQNFISVMQAPTQFREFKYVYLTRRNVAAQAVSLYMATASSVFHTNIAHGEQALEKLKALEYSYTEIKNWQEHILQQEKGWEAYFSAHQLFPLCITYEQIEADVLQAARRIATYLGLDPALLKLPDQESVFRKIGDTRNIEWSVRFMADQLKDAGAKPAQSIEIQAAGESDLVVRQ